MEFKLRRINSLQIGEMIKELTIQANFRLDSKILAKFQQNVAIPVVSDLILNADIANTEKVPICQDTGFVIVYFEIGQELVIEGDSLETVVNSAVEEVYRLHKLRKSILNDPILRENTKTNIPVIIHTTIVLGDKLKITLTVKGGGSENKSAQKMLNPADGVDGISEFVISTVLHAGANACPPFVIGIGIGGTFDYVTFLAKKALLRSLGEPSKQEHIASLESNLLHSINELNIGPAGMGGSLTAMAVHIESYACHIASLPVAVNIGCHANRHAEVVL